MHAAQSRSIEYLYDANNRADVVRILVKVSGQKAGGRREVLRLLHPRTISSIVPARSPRAKLNALVDALIALGDVPARGNVERFLLPGVAQLSD